MLSILNSLIFFILFSSHGLGLCLWESNASAVPYSGWTRLVAEAGCSDTGCVPLGSWDADPFRDSWIYNCDILRAMCNRTLSTSLPAAYGKPMLRSYRRVGFQSDVGWWSGSTRTGEYIEGAYINSSDAWLFGAGNIEHDHEGVMRKWLCVCM